MFKNLMIAVSISVVLVTPVLAQQVQIQSLKSPVNSVEIIAAESNKVDVQQLFKVEEGKTLQVAALSPQEMQDTEGAGWFRWVWLIISTLFGGSNANHSNNN
jgi:hypothetical protein